MNIKEIFVPKGVRYISEWKDFKLPEQPEIIDKQIPGCGFTQWCLTNNENVILCSPRKMLLENKKKQLGKDVFLVKSFYFELGVDKETSSKRISSVNLDKEIENKKETIEKAKKNFELIKNELINFWLMCKRVKKPCKILVTYDSFRKVKEVFSSLNVFEDFYVVVDEFQSIFIDSRFKSDTEMEFMNTLQDVQKVCYVSATPMIEDYLDRIKEFQNLPYKKLNWIKEDPARITKPALEIYSLRSIKSVGEKIIKEYRSGEFKKSAIKINGTSKIIESKEAVIYVNSVNNIINLISWNSLKPEECNILCADTEDNLKRIHSKLGKEFSIGSVPTKEEPRKMFTFCTRTVYLGADFYSDNARSFILSDANVDSMAVDITLDLPQILGRQRLTENPWKNKAVLYVKVIAKKNKVAIKEFENLIKAKIEQTESLLRSYDRALSKDKTSLAKKYLVGAISMKYRDDYVAVNRHFDSSLVPVINSLALISEQRAYDIQQIDYADRFSVFSRLDDVFGNEYLEDEINKEVTRFMINYDQAPNSTEKMKLLCTSNLPNEILSQILDQVLESHKKFYLFLGPERCRSLGYNHVRMERECQVKTFDPDKILQSIYSEFKEGDKISKYDIKEQLRKIYTDLNYKRSPKANDIEEWFETKRARISVNGKIAEGYELIKKKK